MSNIIRKKMVLPIHLDKEQLEAIFTRLEERPETPQSKRVEKILELLSSLRDDISPLDKGQIVIRLRNALRLYQWVSHIAPAPESYRVINGVADRENLSKNDLWEYEAVRDLLECVPYLGNPPRIRRCAECPRWFFAARRIDQKWCGSVCRQRHYDRDPETRAKKLEAMHTRYILEKERDRRRKAAVGYTEKSKNRKPIRAK